MANVLVTFRIEYDSTYSDRYASFTEKARQLAIDGMWDEPTSFLAFHANGTAQQICDQLYFGSKFDATKDLMLVIDLTRREFAQRGVQYPATLQKQLGMLR